MMKLGYARVSTNEQDTAAQVSALKSAGCEKIFREKASGGRWDRPELHRLLDQLRKGDVLIVARLDRLSRSLRDVLAIMEKIQEAEAGFRSLSEAIDTTTTIDPEWGRLESMESKPPYPEVSEARAKLNDLASQRAATAGSLAELFIR
jgi:DNA invertase Pin-like site-specific DNA recombinase